MVTTRLGAPGPSTSAPDVEVDIEGALGLSAIEPRQVALGAGVIVAAWLLGRVVRTGVRWWLARRRTPSYSRVFSSLAAFTVVAIGVGAGLTIAFPSVRPVDVLGGIGIVSIALGIAFQNVLSNLFAGLLILVREPFRAGDQIAVEDVRGTVEEVNLRETVVRTFDGRRVLVPNSTVHSEVLTVQTGYAQIRTSVIVGVGYGTDLPHALRVALDALHGLPGVADDPPPECLLVAMGPSTVDLEIRFWSGARQLETLDARHRVIQAVVVAFTEEGIDMPPDVRRVEVASESLRAALAPAAGPTARREDGDRSDDGEDVARTDDAGSSPD